MIQKTEKRFGPSFRKRWDPVLGVHAMDILRYRRHPLIGSPQLPCRAPVLARTFRKILDDASMEPGSLRQSIRQKRRIRARSTVRAEPSFFFSMFTMRLSLARIPSAAHAARPVHDLFLDMLGSDALKAYVRESRENGEELYAALSNNDWMKDGELWCCSMRAAGRIVAELRNKYEWYLDFYCAGNEGDVSREISDLLEALGWSLAPDGA